tara:strand:- start:5374 stop:7611 length:2238 start_codon:yes stop_codon:yes gene_type:complete
MASPYTKDITKSSAFRQVTGQDRDKFDEVLEGATQIKKAYNNNVSNNIKALADDKVIEIQKKKLMLKGLNGVSNIQNDIRDNFNNDVNAWARNYAQKELRNEAISKYGLEDSDTNQITLTHPDSAYGDWLNKRAQGIADNYNNLVKELDSVGLPYKDLEEGSTFIDKVYQSAFNGLERQNKFNLINSVGSLFKGHGLGNKSASELKAEFNSNIANSSISKLESINNTFKALYASNPELAKDYQNVVDKADIRQNIQTKFSDVKEETRFDKKTGKTFKHKYQEVTHSWTDKMGNPKTSVSLVPVTGEGSKIDVTPAGTFAANAIYLRMLKQEGHEAYYNLLGDFEPYEAFMKVRGEFGKEFDELQAEALRKELAPEIMTNWANIQESYFITNAITGEQALRADIQAYKANPNSNAKPLDYYNNINEYAKDILGIAMNVEPMNKDYQFPDKRTYQVDSSLSDSNVWKSFTSNSEQINEIKEDLDISMEFEEELLKDFEAGIYGNVDKYGNYFPMRNEQLLLQTASDTGRALYLNPDVLDQLGLDSSEFDGGAKIGYNVKTKKLVLQPFSNQSLFKETQEDEEDVVPTRPTGGIFTRTLQAVNDIPVIGAGTEFLFGDEATLGDLFVFVPVAGGLALGGKIVFKAGQKLTNKMLTNTYEKMGKKMLDKGYDPFKEGAKFGKISPSGKSVELKSIGEDLIKVPTNAALDPIKKGTAIIIGKDTKGRLYRIGGVGGAAAIETITTPDYQE